MERKRAPGGGRKPNGNFAGKSAAFSTRITPELRARLDEEAKKSGHSISQIVERLLRETLDSPKRMQRALGPDHVRALAYMIARVVSSLEITTGRKWNDDPFTFQAAQEAIRVAVREFAPKGEMTVPEAIGRRAAIITENADPKNKEAEASYMTQPHALGIIHALMFMDMLARDIEPRHDLYDREERFTDDDQSLLPFIKRQLEAKS